MNQVVLRSFVRRWYVLLAGVLIAGVLSLGAWIYVPPQYERSASQLLLAGKLSLPENANPFLFLGGLTSVADVVARALGSENTLNDLAQSHPDVAVTVGRDATTSGPVIAISVTGPSDTEVEAVLGALVDRTPSVVNQLQEAEGIPPGNRITVLTITVDEQGTMHQRSRYLATAAVGIVLMGLSVIFAIALDGLRLGRQNHDARTKKATNDGDNGERGTEAAKSFPEDSISHQEINREVQRRVRPAEQFPYSG